MARLTAARRRSLPRSDFAIEERRAYPVEDKGHAEAAMGEVEAHGSASDQRRVRAEVKKRYPAFRRHRPH